METGKQKIFICTVDACAHQEHFKRLAALDGHGDDIQAGYELKRPYVLDDEAESWQDESIWQKNNPHAMCCKGVQE